MSRSRLGLLRGVSRLRFENPTKSWWLFDGSDDAMRLLGTDSKATLFDPASNSDDFTVAGYIRPTDVSGIEAMFAKHNGDGVDERSWAFFKNNTSIGLAVSRDGTDTNQTILYRTGLSAGTDAFICGRFKYSGTPGITSRLTVDVDSLRSLVTNGNGPCYSTTDADVQIADYDYTADRFYAGRIYWLAYWNRELTDQEVDDLRDQITRPWELEFDFYTDFHKSVEATYQSEYGEITLTIEGSPVLNGA